MPLYLVRWPGPRASIIQASGEDELMERIDEVDTPGQCTWSVYREELWIDFALPIKGKFAEKHPGPLRRDEIQISDVSDFLEAELRVSVPETDTGAIMELAILRGAFPKTAAVFEEAGAKGDELPDRDRLRGAIADDIVDHDRATALDAAKLGPDLKLTRTTIWIFRRLEDGSFLEVEPTKFMEFLCGDFALEPER